MPSAYEGTDIISYLQSKYIMRQRRISYRVSDISLKNIAFYDIMPLKEGVFMSENKLLDLSFEFAVAIVNLVDGVTAPKSSYMTDQLARAGTSVGANIHEANYASSKADFTNKLKVALKECYETDYWLGLFKDTNMITQNEYDTLYSQCSKIRKLLISSITTAKGNMEQKEN